MSIIFVPIIKIYVALGGLCSVRLAQSVALFVGVEFAIATQELADWLLIDSQASP